MFFISHETLLEEKARYNLMDKSEIDENMRKICELINQHPKVVTMHCCEGHQTKEEPRQYFYLSVAISDKEGQDFIERVFSKWSHLMYDHFWKHMNKPRSYTDCRLEVSRSFDTSRTPSLRWVWILDIWLTRTLKSSHAYEALAVAVIDCTRPLRIDEILKDK